MRIVVLVVLAACSKGEKKHEAVVATPPPVMADAAIATPEAGIPDEIGEHQGVVFAEQRGGTVEGIPDLTPVEVVGMKDLMVGQGENGAITVKYAGKQVVLSPERVLVKSALHRSPDNAYTLFEPATGCGDFCHTALYLIAADGRRVRLGDGGVDTVVSWQPTSVAIGSAGLWIVSLPDLKVTIETHDYTAPVYGPDGTLYVRDFDGSAFTFANGKGKRVWKHARKRDDEDDSDPPPVTFANGKPKYELGY